jgi:hypothetical protein
MSDWPWPYASEKHREILAERHDLITAKFHNIMTEEQAIRLACIRGMLDVIEEERERLAPEDRLKKISEIISHLMAKTEMGEVWISLHITVAAELQSLAGGKP